MDRIGCVYALVDPRTKAIHYIGQTIQAVYRRYREHWVSYSPNDQVSAWFDNLRASNLEPELRILEEGVQSSDLKGRERYWIAWALDQKEPLLNVLIYRPK